jgi:DNA replicative helicase MCM subunit Mcm2 (Cdc46/Mcm family)
LSRADIFGGLANRFIWVGVRRRKLLPWAGQASQDQVQEITKQVIEAATFARGIQEIKLSPKAMALWANEYVGLSAERAGSLGAITARAEAQVLRLAAIAALMNQSHQILIQHLRAARAIWDYSFDSTRFLFGRSAITLEDRILNTLKAASRGLTRTEISGAFHHHVRSQRIVAALDALSEKKLVKSEKRGTEGRTAERWNFIGKSSDDGKEGKSWK